jgi:AGZA family xanthine/uracil permease-like MFS transporter
MGQTIERFFKVKARGSKISVELLAGFVTFLAMSYILPVNAGILAEMGMSTAGVFASTALVSGLITILMGFLANVPISLSAGMGLNAFLTYTVSQTLGYSWQECMVLLTITGVLFFILSVTPLRLIIINSIPKDIQHIISAGLGAFIAFVGLKGSGIIVANASTLVGLGNLGDAKVWLALVGILFTLFLMGLKTKHEMINRMAIPLGLLVTATLGVSLHYIGQAAGTTYFSALPSFYGEFGLTGLSDVVFYGALSNAEGINHDIGGLFVSVFANPQTYAAIFSLIFVNLFDTTATLLAVSEDAGLLNKDGKLTNNRAVIADAAGALICGPLGTSTVTSFAESTVGVRVGARTGLASIMSGLLFIVAAFAFPVFSAFTSFSVTAPALVAVGCLIFTSNFKGLDWKDIAISSSAFITVLLIVLTYSLTSGIGFGLLVYCIMMIASGRSKQISWPLYIVTILFLASFGINTYFSFYA